MHRFAYRSLLVLVLGLFAAGASAEIVINEIMYNSPGTDVEFVEIMNRGTEAIDITGWYMLDDNLTHPRCYLHGILDPDEYLVIAGDLTIFQLIYPDVTNLNPNDFDPGGLGFGLGNTSDTVFIFDPLGTVMDWVTYQDGGDWPGSADGEGPSLELVNPFLDNTLPTSWDPSIPMGGTPGVVNSTYQENQSPVCREGGRDIDLPTSSDSVNVSAEVWDNEGLGSVTLYVDLGAGYLPQDMYDDGLHGDGAAGDSIWGSTIGPQASGTLVRYYVEAIDDIGQENLWPDEAPEEYRAYTVDHTLPDLLITEILAVNNTGITDPYGQYDDWMEIYNAGEEAIDLEGFFLSDNLEATHKFILPSYLLEPGEYLIVWADADTIQGPLHTNFKLSSGGEGAAIFDTEDHGNVLIHGFTYGLQTADVSVGLKPLDADWPEYLSTPTPGADNASSSLFSDICINEFQCTSESGGIDDWIEIYNRGLSAVDISGYFLSDDLLDPIKWAFPPGTVMESGEYIVIYEDVLGFGWSSSGVEVALLTGPDGLTGIDFYDMGPQLPDISEGRYPNGEAYWHFYVDKTPGSANGAPVAVDEIPGAAGLQLRGAWPNPFNPSTRIAFSLEESAQVCATVHSLEGRLLKTLAEGPMDAGEHQLQWNGRDDRGRPLPSGIYFVRVAASDHAKSTKLVLLK